MGKLLLLDSLLQEMEEAWLWYGPDDPVSLDHVRQAGAKTVSTALFHLPAGQVWPEEEILLRQSEVRAAGLDWTVVESIPVHEVIKRGRPADKVVEYTSNYCETMRRLARAGIPILSYSFMPLFDWVRTDLSVNWRDGTKALALDMDKIRMWDIHILRREGAELSYSEKELSEASSMYSRTGDAEKAKLTSTILQGLHGQKEYTLDEVREELKLWSGLDGDQLRTNLKSFASALLNVAKTEGMHISLHPDDPPWGLLGLPTAASSLADYQELFESLPSQQNGMTFCMGSLASNHSNDVLQMAKLLKSRVRFVHLRNVERLEQGGLVESGHLEGSADLVAVMKVLVSEQEERVRQGQPGRLPMRADHGHLVAGDPLAGLPGHSLIGRLRGLAEMRGIQAALSSLQKDCLT